MKDDKGAPIFPNWHEACDQIGTMLRAVRQTGGHVVVAPGCFDILTAGHVSLLEYGKQLRVPMAELGPPRFERKAFLVVALNSDESVRKLKGYPRPWRPFGERAACLAGLRFVDAVIGFDMPDPSVMLDAVFGHEPFSLLKGEEYRDKPVPEMEQAWGAKRHYAKMLPVPSTTALEDSIYRWAKDEMCFALVRVMEELKAKRGLERA